MKTEQEREYDGNLKGRHEIDVKTANREFKNLGEALDLIKSKFTNAVKVIFYMRRWFG